MKPSNTSRSESQFGGVLQPLVDVLRRSAKRAGHLTGQEVVLPRSDVHVIIALDAADDVHLLITPAAGDDSRFSRLDLRGLACGPTSRIALVLVLLLAPSTRGTDIPTPLEKAPSTLLNDCVKQRLAVLQPITPLQTQADVNCDKADLPKCETKSSSVNLSVTAAPGNRIVPGSAKTSYTKPGYSRQVDISPPTAHDTYVTATLSCLGWGCDPEKGGSPGTGFLVAQQQRIATEDEISWAVYQCTQQVLK